MKCGQKFAFAPKAQRAMKKGTDVDWRELVKGDYIKSIQGHGPFFPVANPEEEEESVVFVGHHGYFEVDFVDKEGIGAYEVHKGYKSGGFCYLYMGKAKLSITGSVMRSHKIKKVIPRRKA